MFRQDIFICGRTFHRIAEPQSEEAATNEHHRCSYLRGISGTAPQPPTKENFEKNGALWCILVLSVYDLLIIFAYLIYLHKCLILQMDEHYLCVCAVSTSGT